MVFCSCFRSLTSADAGSCDMRNNKDSSSLQDLRFEYEIIQKFDLHTPIQDHSSMQIFRRTLNYSNSISLSIKKLKKINNAASRSSSFSFSTASLPISKNSNELDEKSRTYPITDFFTPLYNIFQWNEAPYSNLDPSHTPFDKLKKKSHDDLDDNQNIPERNIKNENVLFPTKETNISDNTTTISNIVCNIEFNDNNTLDRQSNKEISSNTEIQKVDSSDYFPSSLASELSHEIFQFFSTFSLRDNNNWILGCCSYLIPLCYLGEGSEIIQNKNSGEATLCFNHKKKIHVFLI